MQITFTFANFVLFVFVYICLLPGMVALVFSLTTWNKSISFFVQTPFAVGVNWSHDHLAMCPDNAVNGGMSHFCNIPPI